MWYRTSSQPTEIYYVSDSPNAFTEPTFPWPALSKIHIRDILPTDKVIKMGIWLDANGLSHNYKYLSPKNHPGTKNSQVNMKGYPEHPTHSNLLMFMQKQHLNKGLFAINDDIFIGIDGHHITVSFQGNYILTWSSEAVTFYSRDIRTTNDALIDYYETFAGKGFEYRLNKEYGYWEIKTPVLTEWIPMFHNMMFNPNGIFLKPYTNNLVPLYLRQLKAIDEYVESLSLETVCRVVGNAPRGSLVASRCIGCKVGNKSHLKVHVQRKELPFYLLLSAIAEFAEREPQTVTWELIEGCRNNDKAAFQQIQTNINLFLQKSIIKTELMVNLPESSPNRRMWSSAPWKHKEVDDNPLSTGVAPSSWANIGGTSSFYAPNPISFSASPFSASPVVTQEEETQLEEAVLASWAAEDDVDES